MGKGNVALILDTLDTGGAEKTAALLSQVLAGAGYNVYFFLDRYNGKQAYKHMGRVVRICTGGTSNARWDMRLRAAYLKELKRELEIDCSISFMEDYNFANVISNNIGKTIVSVRTYLSGRQAEWPQQLKFYRQMIPRLYNKADAVVVMTKLQAIDLIDAFGVNKGRIHIIPNAVDHVVEEQETENSLPVPRFVTIGRLIDVKAQWQGIRAMQQVLKKVPKAHLYILGNGENYAVLSKLARDLHIEQHIHLEGFQRDLGYYLRGATALIHTAGAEGFVNAILDGLDRGLPIIATDCRSSPREILAPDTDGRCLSDAEYAEYGILVPLPDLNKHNTRAELTSGEQALAEAMIRLATETTLREHYAVRARERAADYSLEQVGKKWLDLVENL